METEQLTAVDGDIHQVYKIRKQVWIILQYKDDTDTRYISCDFWRQGGKLTFDLSPQQQLSILRCEDINGWISPRQQVLVSKQINDTYMNSSAVIL